MKYRKRLGAVSSSFDGVLERCNSAIRSVMDGELAGHDLKR